MSAKLSSEEELQLQISLLCCEAVEQDNPKDFLQRHSSFHNITEYYCHTEENSKVLLAFTSDNIRFATEHANVPLCPTLFICFSNNFKSFEDNTIFPFFESLRPCQFPFVEGLCVQGHALERSDVSLQTFFNLLGQGYTLVTTGYQFGGMVAQALASNLLFHLIQEIATAKQFGMELNVSLDKVKSYTFGAPYFAEAAMDETLRSYGAKNCLNTFWREGDGSPVLFNLCTNAMRFVSPPISSRISSGGAAVTPRAPSHDHPLSGSQAVDANAANANAANANAASTNAAVAAVVIGSQEPSSGSNSSSSPAPAELPSSNGTSSSAVLPTPRNDPTAAAQQLAGRRDPSAASSSSSSHHAATSSSSHGGVTNAKGLASVTVTGLDSLSLVDSAMDPDFAPAPHALSASVLGSGAVGGVGGDDLMISPPVGLARTAQNLRVLSTSSAQSTILEPLDGWVVEAAAQLEKLPRSELRKHPLRQPLGPMISTILFAILPYSRTNTGGLEDGPVSPVLSSEDAPFHDADRLAGIAAASPRVSGSGLFPGSSCVPPPSFASATNNAAWPRVNDIVSCNYNNSNNNSTPLADAGAISSGVSTTAGAGGCGLSSSAVALSSSASALSSTARRVGRTSYGGPTTPKMTAKDSGSGGSSSLTTTTMRRAPRTSDPASHRLSHASATSSSAYAGAGSTSSNAQFGCASSSLLSASNERAVPPSSTAATSSSSATATMTTTTTNEKPSRTSRTSMNQLSSSSSSSSNRHASVSHVSSKPSIATRGKSGGAPSSGSATDNSNNSLGSSEKKTLSWRARLKSLETLATQQKSELASSSSVPTSSPVGRFWLLAPFAATSSPSSSSPSPARAASGSPSSGSSKTKPPGASSTKFSELRGSAVPAGAKLTHSSPSATKLGSSGSTGSGSTGSGTVRSNDISHATSCLAGKRSSSLTPKRMGVWSSEIASEVTEKVERGFFLAASSSSAPSSASATDGAKGLFSFWEWDIREFRHDLMDTFTWTAFETVLQMSGGDVNRFEYLAEARVRLHGGDD